MLWKPLRDIRAIGGVWKEVTGCPEVARSISFSITFGVALLALLVMLNVSGCKAVEPEAVVADEAIKSVLRFTLNHVQDETTGRCFSGFIEVSDLEAVIPIVATRIYPQTCPEPEPEMSEAISWTPGGIQ